MIPSCIWIMVASSAADISTKIGFGVFCLVALGLCGWLTAFAFERIDAGEKGIRWRSWRGLKRIAWDEVNDYYLLPRTDRGEQAVIVTRQGTISTLASSPFCELLREIVQARATEAATKEWGYFGCRTFEPEPIVFRYDVRGVAAQALYWTALALIMGIGMHPRGRMDVDLIARYVGPGWALGSMAIAWIMPTLGVLLMAVGFTRLALDTRKRLGDTVTVTADGISFTGEGKQITARWVEVIGWERPYRSGLAPNARLRVKTEQWSFEVTAQLRNFNPLAAILRHRCGDRGITEDIEVLPVDTTRWLRGTTATNAIVHHYRTRSNRIMILAPWILLAAASAVRIATRSLDLPKSHEDDISPLVMGVLIFGYVLVTVWLTWRYRSDAIVVDDEGITEFSLFGVHRIAWSKIESYHYDGFHGIVKGQGKNITFKETITSIKELFQAIEKGAVNSRNKNWNSVPKGYGFASTANAASPEDRRIGD